MERIGWFSADGITLVDDLGISRRIDQYSPQLWRILLKETIQRQHETELGTKNEYPELRGKRVCVDVVMTVARQAKTTVEGSRVLIANACNAIWTKVRAQSASYDLDTTKCELCGAHEDTIHGRLWKCTHPDVVKARNGVSSARLRKDAIAAGPNSAIFNRGLLPHVADSWPEADDKCTFELS